MSGAHKDHGEHCDGCILVGYVDRAERAEAKLADAEARLAHMPLDAILLGYKDGDDHGWHQEFCWLEANHRAALDALKVSIQQDGIREPILLGNDGRVWDGHHRLWVADRLGLDRVPVRFAADGATGRVVHPVHAARHGHGAGVPCGEACYPADGAAGGDE